MRSLRTLLAVLATLTAAGAGEHWPHWRGPAWNGTAGETPLPDRLDDATRLWSVDMPGPSSGTPAVWNDRVFVATPDKRTKDLLALCVERTTGRELWRAKIGVGFTSNQRNDLAACSPVCDAERAVFIFGSGDLAAFDHAGKELWRRNLQQDHGKFLIQWLYASSPTLIDGRLYVQYLGRPSAKGQQGSWLLCIDAATGKDRWKHTRATEALGESLEAYTTPIPARVGGTDALLLVGGDLITAHDASDGRELWRRDLDNPTRAKNWRLIPSAVVAGDLAVVFTARGAKAVAVKLADGAVAWASGEFTSDVCVPAPYRGALYAVDGDKRTIACVDPASGAVRWRGEFGETALLRASPTAGNGKIYCINEAGKAWVLAAGDEYRVLWSGELGGGTTTRASIALAQGTVIVRTGEQLSAFGVKK